MIQLRKIRKGSLFKYKGVTYVMPFDKQCDQIWCVYENDERAKREYIDRDRFVEPL